MKYHNFAKIEILYNIVIIIKILDIIFFKKKMYIKLFY